jgi:polysaccharide export outer membrane protein
MTKMLKKQFRSLCLPAALWAGLGFSFVPGGLRAVVPQHAADLDENTNTVPVVKYPSYLIGPGDLLSVTVYGEKDLPTNYLVDSNGTIVFPLVGEIKAEGSTQSELGAKLAVHLAKYLIDPQVTVLILETNNYNVSILGQVTKPGKFRLRGRSNFLDVMAEAGGPLDSADLKHSVLIRNNRKTHLNLQNYLQEDGDIRNPLLLYPGDVVMIPKSTWPNLAEWGIIAGILTSAALLSVTIRQLK